MQAIAYLSSTFLPYFPSLVQERPSGYKPPLPPENLPVQLIDTTVDTPYLGKVTATNNSEENRTSTSVIRERLKFASFVLEPHSGILTRYGVRKRIERQPARILEALLLSRGQLVSRSELISLLWPSEAAGDFNRRLDKAVAKLRATLNDSPTSPRYFETLKGRGYRFLIEVEIEPLHAAGAGEAPGVEAAVTPPPTPAPTDNLSAGPGPKPPRSAPEQPPATVWTRRNLLVGALALAVLAIAGWSVFRSESNHGGRPAILILGFRNSSAPTRDLWISRFLTDWLAADLQLAGDAQVLFGNGTPEMRPWTLEQGCGTPPESALRSAARDYDADMVLYGDYAAAATADGTNRWQLTLCLVPAHGHKAPVSATVTEARDDFPLLVAEAAERLRAAAGFKPVAAAALANLRAEFPHTPDATRAYSQGVIALDHFDYVAASIFLTIAAQLEPKCPAVHAALAKAWAALGTSEPSREEAQLAVQEASHLSAAQQLRYAAFNAEARQDWTTAAEFYRQLRQADPGHFENELALARAEFRAGQTRQALQTAQGVQSPLSALHDDPRMELVQGVAKSVLGDFKGELEAAQRAEREAASRGMDERRANALMEEADAEEMLGNWQDAQRLWTQAKQVFASINAQDEVITVLHHQALSAWNRHDITTAEERIQEAIDGVQSRDDAAEIQESLEARTNVQIGQRAAIPLSGRRPDEQFEIAEDPTPGRNLLEEANLFEMFGSRQMRQDQGRKAQEYLQRAQRLCAAAKNQACLADAALNLGMVDEEQGRMKEAEAEYQQSVSWFQAAGDHGGVALTAGRLGWLLFEEDRLDECRKVFSDALAQTTDIANTMRHYELEEQLTDIELQADPARAQKLAQQSLTENAAMLNAFPIGRLVTFANLAVAEYLTGGVRQAQRDIAVRFPLGNSVLPDHQLAKVLFARGTLSMYFQNYPDAEQNLQAAEHLARQQRLLSLDFQVRLTLAQCHTAQHLPTARAEVESLRSEAEHRSFAFFLRKIQELERARERGEVPTRTSAAGGG